MPLQRYVLSNPDTVTAILYDGTNAQEVFEAFKSTFMFEIEDSLSMLDHDGMYVDVHPGTYIVQFHDASIEAMSKEEFETAYELHWEEMPPRRGAFPHLDMLRDYLMNPDRKSLKVSTHRKDSETWSTQPR